MNMILSSQDKQPGHGDDIKNKQVESSECIRYSGSLREQLILCELCLGRRQLLKTQSGGGTGAGLEGEQSLSKWQP